MSLKLKSCLPLDEEAPLEKAKGKEAQLEVVLHFMRSRLDEVQRENLDYRNKIAESQQLAMRHQIDLQQHIRAFEIERKKNEELILEESSLKSQFEQLKRQINLLEEDKKTWSVKADEQQTALQSGEKEAQLLKQMMMKTVQEFKEERLAENQQFQSQIDHLMAQNGIKQKELDDLKGLFEEKQQAVRHLTLENEANASRLHQLTSDLQTKNIAHFELTKFTEELQSKLMRAEELRELDVETLRKKEELIEHLSSQVASLSRSLGEREEAIQNIEEERHEHESCLKAAQTHLAKKVREAALLAEKYEESQKELQAVIKDKEASEKKVLEMHAVLDVEEQHKLQVQQQHRENLKTLETQSAKWEEKYFKLHDKWQEVEGKSRELKRLEERFSKMQIAFSQFNQVFASSLPLPQAEEMNSFVEMENSPPQEKSAPFVQPTLFQTTKTPSRFKETLFG